MAGHWIDKWKIGRYSVAYLLLLTVIFGGVIFGVGRYVVLNEPLPVVQDKRPVYSSPINMVWAYEKALADDEQFFKTSKASDADLDTIHETLALFRRMAEEINAAHHEKDGLSERDAAFLKKVEQRLSALQQRTLPGMRLAFKKQAATILWEHDIAVSVSGAGNTVLKLTSFWFATNANIKAAEVQLDDITQQLRFKEVRFSDGIKGIAHKLDTPADGVIAMYSDGEGFQKPDKRHSAP